MVLKTVFLTLNLCEFAKLRALRALRAFGPSCLRALHAFVPYVPSRLTCLDFYAPELRAFRALFAICAPYSLEI